MTSNPLNSWFHFCDLARHRDPEPLHLHAAALILLDNLLTTNPLHWTTASTIASWLTHEYGGSGKGGTLFLSLLTQEEQDQLHEKLDRTLRENKITSKKPKS